MQVYGDFEDLETGEKRTGEEGKDAEGEEEEEEEEAPRIVDYGGDAAREKGGNHSGPFRIVSHCYKRCFVQEEENIGRRLVIKLQILFSKIGFFQL
jgi:hypothetical protein